MGTPAQAAVTGTVPIAFVGRTSTTPAQAPVQPLPRQVRRAEERLPEGFYIARYYWDVESGGTDLDLRSQSAAWQQFAGSGVPRDRGWARCAPRSPPASR